MIDINHRFRAGEPLNGIPAEILNRWQDAADWITRRRSADEGNRVKLAVDGTLLIKNVRGSALPQFAVVRRGAKLVGPSGSSASFFGESCFESASPLAAAPFALLEHPCREDFLVAAKMEGRSFCKLNLASTSHVYANAADGVYTSLLSQSSPGPAEILWADIPVSIQLDGGIDDSQDTLSVDPNSDWPSVTLLGQFVIRIGTEDMLVTATSGTGNITWTVARGYNGTTASSHADNAAVSFVSGILWAEMLITGTAAASPQTFIGVAVGAIPGRTITTPVIAILTEEITEDSETVSLSSLGGISNIADGKQGTIVIDHEEIIVRRDGSTVGIVCRGANGSIEVDHAVDAIVRRKRITFGSGYAVRQTAVQQSGEWDMTGSCEQLAVLNPCSAIPDDSILRITREQRSGQYWVELLCAGVFTDGTGVEEDCPCVESAPPGIVCVSITGVTNSDCDHCDFINDDFNLNLRYDCPAPGWDNGCGGGMTSGGAICSPNFGRACGLAFFYIPEGHPGGDEGWYLNLVYRDALPCEPYGFPSDVIATWYAETWDCSGPLTMNRITPADTGPDEEGFCQTYPDEVTVTPGDCSGSGSGGGGGDEWDTVVWLDSFADADSTDLADHLPDTGTSYVKIFDSLQISGNTLVTTSASQAIYTFGHGVVGTNTQTTVKFQLTVTDGPEFKSVYLSQRFVDASNYILAGMLYTGGVWRAAIAETIGGTVFGAAFSTTMTIHPDTEYTMIITNNGETVTVEIVGQSGTLLDTTAHASEDRMAFMLVAGSGVITINPDLEVLA